MSFQDVSLGVFLARAASDAPTPGGGALAAVGGALGAAMIAMTARLTLGRPRYAAVQDAAAALAEQADRAWRALLALADADADAYERVMAALRLPRATDAERAARQSALQQALVSATQVPAAIAEQCQAVLALAETAAAITNRNALGDVATGALLAEAGMRAAAVQAELNLAGIEDAAFVERMAAALAPQAAGAAERLERILATVRQRAAERV
ncbi:MAG TPA: cyclodeaminase/cyclohydrolase family protein [Chloroflexota bacterium]|jgi:formiminotetrahydrofolate cyclodeaminase|nr:cyclodeaminase/cyclohydrolase family protein [Chloroflexota bacterium]